MKKHFISSLVLVLLFVAVSAVFAEPVSNNLDDILCDRIYYADKYSDLKQAFGYDHDKLLNHWRQNGAKEGRSSSSIYDAQYYYNKYADLRNAFTRNGQVDWAGLYNHFKQYGINEGRQASQHFSVSIYKENYADLRNAFGTNASDNWKYLKHWREHGMAESRNATSRINPKNNSEAMKSTISILPVARPANGDYFIVPRANSGFALDAVNGGTTQGTNLQCWSKNNSYAQIFRIQRVNGDWYRITLRAGGLCMNVAGGSNKNDARLWLYPDDGTASCYWRFRNAGNNYYIIESQLSGNRVLDLDNNRAFNGAIVHLWDNHQGASAQWQLVTAPAEKTQPTNNLTQKINAFLSDSRWKIGTSWGARKPKLSTYSCTGCMAYAADFVKYVFGKNSPRDGTQFKNVAEIRAGDVIYLARPHWFVVIGRNGDSLETIEANWNGPAERTNGVYRIVGSNILRNGKNIGNFSYGYHY